MEISDGAVTAARASGTLFRGFERMLRGRSPTDALVILPRICGQCGAAHSAAAARALARIAGVEPPPHGVLAWATMQSVETVLSHLAHFCFTFVSDMGGLPGAEDLGERFSPVSGRAFQKWLRARRVLLAVMGLFAGKSPDAEKRIRMYVAADSREFTVAFLSTDPELAVTKEDEEGLTFRSLRGIVDELEVTELEPQGQVLKLVKRFDY